MKIKITRQCEANLGEEAIHNGLTAGTILTGDFRAKDDPKNGSMSWGCVEIDTKDGTYVIPEDAYRVVAVPRITMRTYWIEVYSPAWPNTKTRFRVWAEYPGAELSASLTHLFEVNASDMNEAVAKVLAGEGRTLISPDGKKLKLV